MTFMFLYSQFRRQYVSTYWPSPDTAPSKIKNMYDRIAAAREAAAKEAESSSGHLNGVTAVES